MEKGESRNTSFKIIVFTSPTSVKEEIKKLTQLLEAGVDYIHIRKPEWNKSQIENLIRNIDNRFYPKLRLHDFFDLAEKYNLGGVQLNQRNPNPPDYKMSLSSSLHSIAELDLVNKRYNNDYFDYVTLSPIFHSISKKGYTSKFNLDYLNLKNYSIPVIALGGIKPTDFKLLHEKGFSGAGLLGYIWEGSFEEKMKNLREALLQKV